MPIPWMVYVGAGGGGAAVGGAAALVTHCVVDDDEAKGGGDWCRSCAVGAAAGAATGCAAAAGGQLMEPCISSVDQRLEMVDRPLLEAWCGPVKASLRAAERAQTAGAECCVGAAFFGQLGCPAGMLAELCDANLELRRTASSMPAASYAIGQQPAILRRLGAGGYGTVFLARSREGMEVAVKRIPCVDCRAMNRAFTEVTAVMQHPHPNIVTILDFYVEDQGTTPTTFKTTGAEAGDTGASFSVAMQGGADGAFASPLTSLFVSPPLTPGAAPRSFTSFDGWDLSIVMEYCAGGNLEQHARELRGSGPVPLAAWARQIAAALAHLHGAGIVHRDLKPQNVLVSADGSVLKLCDFGLAGAQTQQGQDAAPGVGTLPYAAPEMFANEPHTPRADLFALGCTLYDLAGLPLPALGAGTGAYLGMQALQGRAVHDDCAAQMAGAGAAPAVVRVARAVLVRPPGDRPDAAEVLRWLG